MLKVNNQGSVSTIYLYGPIGDEWGGVTGAMFTEALDSVPDGNSITVRINSEGGNVFDGFAMYNSILQDESPVDVVVDGLAASAASLVAMAGNQITMGRESLMMIHEPQAFAVGDFREMERTAGVLQKVRNQLADAYAKRGKSTVDQYLDLMAAETWYTPDEAVADGLADTVAGEDSGAESEADVAAMVTAKGLIAASRYVVVGFKKPPSRIRGRYVQPVPEDLGKAISMRLQTLAYDDQMSRVDSSVAM